EPAEGYLGQDELDRLVGFLRGGPVVEHEEDPGPDLHHEEEEGHPPEVVPGAVTVQRNGLLLGDVAKGTQSDPIVEPAADLSDHRRLPLDAADEDIVPAHLDRVGLKGPRRRARDIAALEVIHAVVARAPYPVIVL